MLDGILQSNTIPILQEAISFAQARHAALAGNIANMDTPGYQVRDLSVEDFQQRLKRAIEQRDRPTVFRSPGEAAARGTSNIAEVARDVKTILYHDGSNDGIEFQVTEMVKNQMQHNLALALMSSQFRLLQTAISGRV